MLEQLAVAQLAVSSALAGVSWVVQLAVYPQMASVLREAGREGFGRYHTSYTNGMGWVAAPLMLAELALAGLWCWMAPNHAPAWWSAGAVAVVWVMTFAVIVPMHRRLQIAPSETLVRRMVAAHAVRTVAWTARSIGLAVALTRA